MQSPRLENGIVVGTGSDKYQSRNPIARYAISQLLALDQFASFCEPSSVMEVGGGEGHVQHCLARSFLKFLAPEFEVLQVRSLLLWTVVLARPKAKS